MKDNYEKVIVSTSLEQAHAFFLFYLKYDPVKYLQEGGTVSGGFREYRNKFDKFNFHLFDYEKDREKGDYLFVGCPDEFPPGAKIIKTIYYLNGDPDCRTLINMLDNLDKVRHGDPAHLHFPAAIKIIKKLMNSYRLNSRVFTELDSASHLLKDRLLRGSWYPGGEKHFYRHLGLALSYILGLAEE